MSNWIEHLEELASVETDVKKKLAFRSSAKLIKELAKGGTELREELAESKYNHAYTESRLSQSKTELIDTLEQLAALEQSIPKVRADAIRDMLTCIDGAIENDFISMREVEEMTLDDFFTLAKKHANKIEGES